MSESITLIESDLPDKRQLGYAILDATYHHSNQSIRIGISGAPGVGKSTFLNSLTKLLLAQGKKIAILAIDPSSKISGGSILGDKTRMNDLVGEPNVFIRPSAAGMVLGGVQANTYETIHLVEAAGYDIILIETVGVGQSETMVASMVDLYTLLLLPGAGDEVQGIKRGITEVADLVVINKSDGENLAKAKEAVSKYRQALQLMKRQFPDLAPSIIQVSSTENIGIEKTWNAIISFLDKSKDLGIFTEKRKEQKQHWIDSSYRNIALKWFLKDNKLTEILLNLRQNVMDGLVTPFAAIQEIELNMKKK